MKSFRLLLALSLALLAAVCQAKASHELLFAGQSGGLSKADMKSIVRQLGYTPSRDGKGLESADGCGVVDFETRIIDLNGDGRPEVIVLAGNTCTSGLTGRSLFLFVKNKAGKYEQNLGFPADAAVPLAQTSKGFPDLLIGGPGFCRPVWRWNAARYDYFCSREESPGACAKQENARLCTAKAR